MSRGLGAALALSVLVHGGVVAAIAVVGVAWLGEPRPTAEPALYVDAVDPVVATEERRASAVASRPSAEALRGPGPAPRRLSPASPAADAPAPAPAPVRSTPMAGPVEVAVGAVPSTPPAAPTAPLVGEPRVEPPAAVVAPSPSSTPASGVPAPAPSAARPAPASAVAALAPQESVTSDAAPIARHAPAPPAASSPTVGGPVVTGPAPAGPAVTGAALPRGAASDGASEASRSVEPGAAAGSGTATQTGSGSGKVARLPPAESGGAGPGGGIPPEYESYVRALRLRVQERLVYPWMAVRRGLEGVVELEVRVGADGRLAGVEVVAGANADSLRSAAVTAVRGAAPFPFPPGLAARPLVIRLPVEFRLR